MIHQTVQFATNASGSRRVRNIKGVAHVVLDMVMLRTGVHHGNLGPVFYSDEELSRSSEAWNMMPLVENHPVDAAGKDISARRPDVLDKASFGYVMNSRHKTTVGDVPGSAFCEAWVNMDDLTAVNAKMAERVANGETIEISTGLTLDLIPEVGEWKGQKYTHRAVNFRPDHVAFLTKDKGACSIEKGCGVGTAVVVNTEQTPAACSCQTKPAECGCKSKALNAEPAEYIPNTTLRVNNVDTSFSDIYTQAGEWLKEKHPTLRTSDGMTIKSYDISWDGVFPGYFVFSEWEREGGMEFYRVDYTLNDRGKITVADTETPVERQVQFVPTSPENEEAIMTTNAQAAPAAVETVATPAVVVNAAPAVETPAAAPAPVVIAAKLTLNQFVETAPSEIRQDALDAVTALNAVRAGHAAVILAAPGNKFTAEVLNSMPLGMLEATASLASSATPAPVATPAPAAVTNAAPAAPAAPAARVLNYSGAVGAPAPIVEAPAVRHLIPGSKN